MQTSPGPLDVSMGCVGDRGDTVPLRCRGDPCVLCSAELIPDLLVNSPQGLLPALALSHVGLLSVSTVGVTSGLDAPAENVSEILTVLGIQTCVVPQGTT